jgi:hypothetical protein
MKNKINYIINSVAITLVLISFSGCAEAFLNIKDGMKKIDNLVVNPSFEEAINGKISGWDEETTAKHYLYRGAFGSKYHNDDVKENAAVGSSPCDGDDSLKSRYEYEGNFTCAQDGRFLLFGGKLDKAIAIQTIDLFKTTTPEIINNNKIRMFAGGYIQSWKNKDYSDIYIEFLDSNKKLIEKKVITENIIGYAKKWTLVQIKPIVPKNTRYVKFIYIGHKMAGKWNNAYFDKAFVRLDIP